MCLLLLSYCSPPPPPQSPPLLFFLFFLFFIFLLPIQSIIWWFYGLSSNRKWNYASKALYCFLFKIPDVIRMGTFNALTYLPPPPPHHNKINPHSHTTLKQWKLPSLNCFPILNLLHRNLPVQINHLSRNWVQFSRGGGWFCFEGDVSLEINPLLIST